MKKTLIFDFDGTLVDSFGLVFNCVNKLSQKYHYDVFENPDFWRSKSLKEIVSQDVDLNIISRLFFIRDIKKLMNQEYHTLSLFEGIHSLLIKLNRDYDIGIVTTNSSHNVQLILNKYHIDFISFIYADISIFGKSRALRRILKKNHLHQDNTIYIGDEQRDIESAVKSGVSSIAVSWGFNSRELLLTTHPTYIVDTIPELYTTIRNVL